MDIPASSGNNYPDKFLKGYSIFPDDSRIFHRPEFSYDHVATILSARFADGILTLACVLSSGEEVNLTVEAITPQVLRLKAWQGEASFDAHSPMLLPLPESRPSVDFNETGQAYLLSLGAYTLLLHKSPFFISLASPTGETIFESETEQLVELYTSPPLGFRRRDVEKWAFLSWKIRNEERFFGLGEKFTRFEKTSTRATIWQADTCGSNTSDMSYKAVPVLFSTAGWGMLLHTSYRTHWEIGSFSYATGSVLVEDPKIDLFLMLAPSLKEQIQLYTALTGRPSMPPKWSLGVWMSRAPYRNRLEMLEVAERLHAEQIPCDVFNVDPTWMTRNYYNDIGVEVCNFDWNEAAWSKPDELFQEFAAKGLSICLWINPYFSEDSRPYAEAKEKGYLVKNQQGGVSRLEFGLAAGIVDFTNPAARDWWKAKLTDLLRKGASALKVDFGDRVPEDALFFNSKTGKEMHNLYVHLYVAAVYEAVQEAKGIGLVWRRPGYIGSQRFPVTWAGDTQVTWQGMKGALRGGLSAAMTGEAFWSHDIGGFVGEAPSEELYIRWAQFGLLSPLSRFHGITPREPWYFGETALKVVRHYARLRNSLIPYLLATAYESTRTGMPMLRPMVLEFPDEPNVDQLDDQYLLGHDLLVAPIFKAGARSRMVYFPRGKWWRWGNPSASISGPGFHDIEAPLEVVPLYVRAGAIIPRYSQPPLNLKGPTPRQWDLEIYPGETDRQLLILESDFEVKVHYQNQAGRGSLHISPAPITITLRLIGFQPASLTVNGAARDWVQAADQVTLTLDAGGGLEVSFQEKR